MSAMSIANSLCDIDGIEEVYISINGDDEDTVLADNGICGKLVKDMSLVDKAIDP